MSRALLPMGYSDNRIQQQYRRPLPNLFTHTIWEIRANVKSFRYVTRVY